MLTIHRLLTALVVTALSLATGSVTPAGAAVLAPPTRPAMTRGARVFPPQATWGETVWLSGVRSPSPDATVWIGSHPTRLRQDPDTGWLAFTLPEGVPAGPQVIGLSGPARSGLNVTVIPDVKTGAPGAGPLVVYASPAQASTLRETYRDRLLTAQTACAGRCPAEVRRTLGALATRDITGFTPLVPQTDRRTPLTSRRPAPTTPQTGAWLLRPAPITIRPPVTPFCSWLSATLDTTGLPTGQAAHLLALLFPGDLAVDPTVFTHPSQDIPLRDAPIRTTLDVTLGGWSPAGKGVTVHVLDTASGIGAGQDDYAFTVPGGAPLPSYYGQSVDGRPLHGRVVGEIIQTLAPQATVAYADVCATDGTCATLDVARALCAVAVAARDGQPHVVNLSLGGPYPALGLHLALNDVARAGVPTAAAYGNRDDCASLHGGEWCWHFPADWAASAAAPTPGQLYSVAGWDIATQQLATYNRGVGNPGVLAPPPGVQAPGEFWFTPPGATAPWPYYGTSFAAPVISGVLANWMTCQPGLPILPPITTPSPTPIPTGLLNSCP